MGERGEDVVEGRGEVDAEQVLDGVHDGEGVGRRHAGVAVSSGVVRAFVVGGGRRRSRETGMLRERGDWGEDGGRGGGDVGGGGDGRLWARRRPRFGVGGDFECAEVERRGGKEKRASRILSEGARAGRLVRRRALGGARRGVVGAAGVV